MRNLIIALQVRLFTAWLTNTDPTGHWREATLYHSYIALGRLANALRPTPTEWRLSTMK